jgi:hypothetical protein
VQGNNVLDHEVKDIVKGCDQNKILSNLALHLMEHPDFLRYKKKNGEVGIKECK